MKTVHAMAWLAVGLTLAPIAGAAERDVLEKADLAPETAPKQNLAGARVGVEATPVAAAYYDRFGKGIWSSRAEIELSFTSAFLTHLRGGRFRVERVEPISLGRYVLRGILGSSVAFSSDASGHYWGVAGLVGLQLQRPVGRWELGARIAYLPVLFSRVTLSPQARDTFADRYPDARDERGPEGAVLWFSGQRAQAILTARALWTEWALDVAGGLELSPLAGRYWANLEQGQLPILLQIGLARRF